MTTPWKYIGVSLLTKLASMTVARPLNLTRRNDQNDPDQQLFEGYTHDLDQNRWGDCLVCTSSCYGHRFDIPLAMLKTLCTETVVGCQVCNKYRPCFCWWSLWTLEHVHSVLCLVMLVTVIKFRIFSLQNCNLDRKTWSLKQVLASCNQTEHWNSCIVQI